ncbi:nostrin isoform X3 [Patella vulgata]|uniref:nostrin isoform X3 n=1 Tax=Patella vulgata TaxID=6465 RepID=UPI0024A7D39F|nr:nostrin isoform X3 [Patella vulgata]XP_055959181.1 nostrin isoform X3 [Patella vulgata]
MGMDFTSFRTGRTLQLSLPGQDGFEELRKYIKQGSEFSKEVATIIQERAELETSYAKSLSRLSKKLSNAAAGGVGSLSEGWVTVAVAMEQEAELHKNLGTGLGEEIGKPLKLAMEAHSKLRKPIESTVDRSLKSLTDRRTEEYKAKKSAFSCAKDYEKAEDAEVKSGKDKEIKKNEKKCKQSRDHVKKADKLYTECCCKAETARQDWDHTVQKCSTSMQQLEEERLHKMHDFLSKYNNQISAIGPKITQICSRLNESVISVDINNDLQAVVYQKGVKGPRHAEQILVDCYAEDSQFPMKPDRRRSALQNYLLYLHANIEKDKKGREGAQKLVDVYKTRPNFGDAEAQEEILLNLEKITYMLNFLEASHYKISACLAKQDKMSSPTHKFAQYIHTTRDKQNHLVSTLKLPVNLALEGSSEYSYSAGSYSGSNEVYSEVEERRDDSFDDEFEDDEEENTTVISRCKVLYDYTASRSDEISIRAGQIINVYNKQADGWWKGEVDKKVGIFPSTYIEEL